MTAERAQRVMDGIDAANAKDPSAAMVDGRPVPRALLYGQRMTQALDRFMPEAPESLRIAARAQHIERWVVPRASYGEGRIAYLKWRKDLQHHHARRAGEIMAAAGYGEGEIVRVGGLLRKEQLKADPLTQALEDVICLVFLVHEAPEFIAQHDDAKVRDILVKTARKMSAKGLAAAGSLDLDPRLARLLTEALAPPPADSGGA